MAQATIATTVTGLQGHPVATTVPSIVGQLLTWNGSAWAPDNTTYMPVAGGTFTGPVTLAGAATEANQPATLTQVATAAGVNIGRNYIHNPMFNINQRGSASYSPAAASLIYTVDRWGLAVNAAGDSATLTSVVASDADRAAIGDENAENYPSTVFAGGTTATNFIYFTQRIEDVRRLGNKTCTLSFWAYSPTSQRLGLAYNQDFGSGGSPSATVAANIGVAALTTGWQRYQFTFLMPSTAGQTLGTNANTSFTQLTFYFSCPAANTVQYPISGNLGSQSGTINIWGMQLEVGSQATPFEHRDPEIELGLCQRYYQGSAVTALVAWAGASGEGYGVSQSFIRCMRASPTMTAVSPGYTNASDISFGNVTPSGFGLGVVATTGGQYFSVSSFYTASADL